VTKIATLRRKKTIGNESHAPLRGVTDELLRQGEETVLRLRAVLKERVAHSAEEIERVRSWLKSRSAKEVLRQSPAFQDPFSKAVNAAKTLPKEQAAALSAEDKSLNEVLSQLTRVRSALPPKSKGGGDPNE
jgi:hypothetical protein